MEPLMCPFCGGADIIEGEEREVELEDERWIVYHWTCMDCREAFDKVIATPVMEVYEEDEHWS